MTQPRTWPAALLLVFMLLLAGTMGFMALLFLPEWTPGISDGD
jgi:hypothetical protein